ncbi:mast cell protease 1A-like [Salarias fasciatus]|uniref:trypsin n=1 Tax=Salarias fasciatus TaxID=181472 RepID=A0A672HP05_SALFA|nr:mast cell protease 1A-like [Salarias fasciatus]
MQALYKFLLLQVLASLGQQALGSEIIKGKNANKKSMMYMASVQNKMGHACGGFLISEDYVMTAAHCDDWKPESVVLGTHDLKKVNDATMRYSIQKCKHPSYKKLGSGSDIMLLKLSRKALVGKKPIQPVQLPSGEINPKTYKKCKVAGWGLTKTGGTAVPKLQVANVPVIDQKTCQKLWKNKLPANVTCAGGYGTKTGFCQGDSGGPLVCGKDVAVAVASFNNNKTCTYPNIPNIYTDVSKFLPWINRILRKKKC